MGTQGQKIIVGYSGGADSTCLLHWALKQNYLVIAAHLHHGIRREAEDDVKHCQITCKAFDVPLEIGRANVPQIAKNKKISLEEAAREARYLFLNEVCQRYEAEWIFVGHTQDDHLETMLFQMVRGSGLRGLRGLPQQNGLIKRPLWSWTRQQTENYCKHHSLGYLNDSMNQDLQYSRVQIRKKVLPPFLAVHPGARESLFRLSQIVQEEDQYLDEIAHQAIIKCEKIKRFEYERRFWRKSLLEISPVLLKRGLRCIAREWNISLNFILIERVMQGITEGIKGGVNTEGDQLCIHWDKEQLKFRKK